MRLQLKRIAKRSEYTIGKLYVDGNYFCDTLEDPVRVLKDINKDGDFSDLGEGKIYGKTAIPPGKYDITVTYSPKFGRSLPRLKNVPGFEGILIHRGNSAKDTAGCILVGENKVIGRVINSTPYEVQLTKMILTAEIAEITIE